MNGCRVEPIEAQATEEERMRLTAGRVLIWGMRCPNCAARVRSSMPRPDGVVGAIIDHNAGVGRIFYNPCPVTTDELESAVRRAGGDGRQEHLGKLVSIAS